MKFKDYIKENTMMDELPNNNLLTEAGLSRLISKFKENDFVVMSAYRLKYDKKQNIQRNRSLRAEFNKRKMGVYQLIGHWRECQLDDVAYKDCPEEYLVDTIERSYLVVRPREMPVDEFTELIQWLTKKFDQDGSILSIDNDIRIIEPNGNSFTIGSGVTLYKISQAYSQHVKKQGIPFVFECEVPSSNSGKMIMKKEHILYPVCERDELNEWPS